MLAEIVSVGEELLLGSTINTNASWLGDRLDRLGFRTARVVTIGDDQQAIATAILDSLNRSDLVVVTGGLGPTHDDVTKKAVADALGLEIVVDPSVEADLRSFFERRGRTFTVDRQTMAEIPEGFEALKNPVGAAPGLFYIREGVRRSGLLILPGVPVEMKALVETFENEIVRRVAGTTPRLHRTYLTAGITENHLENLVRDLIETRPPDVRFALLPDARTGVRLRVTVDSLDPAAARKQLDETGDLVLERLGTHVYGLDDETLEGVLGRLLRESGRTLAVAESCTGGLISDRITDVPGSSEYFVGGVIAYSDAIKVASLDVNPDTLTVHGAVSKEAALEMAAGCRRRLSADIGVSATGIAGPGGGTPEKPVGTVHLGLSSAEKDLVLSLRLLENRYLNKMLTSTAALNLVRRFLLKIEYD